MLRFNFKSQSSLLTACRNGSRFIHSSRSIITNPQEQSSRSIRRPSLITRLDQPRQFSNSSSTAESDPSSSKTWNQLKLEIESQQKIEEEELAKDPSKQQSSNLASIWRMKMAEFDKEFKIEESHAAYKRRREDSRSRSRPKPEPRPNEKRTDSPDELYVLHTAKDQYFTTSKALTESIGGIFQRAHSSSRGGKPLPNEITDQYWVFVEAPEVRRSYFKRTFYSSWLSYNQSVEFFIKVTELLVGDEDDKGLTRARPRNLSLDPNGRIRLAFGRVLTTGYFRQMQRKLSPSEAEKLKGFTSSGTEEDSLITPSDVAMAEEVELLWAEFLEEKAKEKAYARNLNASQNPSIKAFATSGGFSERESSSDRDGIEDSTPISIPMPGQSSKALSQGLTDPQVKESALATGLGMKDREEDIPPVEESRPVDIESLNDSRQDSLSGKSMEGDRVKEAAIGVGLGMEGRSSHSIGIEEFRPVQIGSSESNSQGSPGEDQSEDNRVKESAIGLGLGINSRESNPKGIEESRPVDIDSKTLKKEDSISERSTKELALEVGMGLSGRESSEESRNVEDSRPVEIENPVNKRRDQMGLMSRGPVAHQSQSRENRVEMEKNVMGRGLGLGMEKTKERTVEADAEETTPIKIGSEEGR